MYRSPPTSTLYIPLFGCGHIQYSLHTNTVPRDGIFPALPRDCVDKYHPKGQYWSILPSGTGMYQKISVPVGKERMPCTVCFSVLCTKKPLQCQCSRTQIVLYFVPNVNSTVDIRGGEVGARQVSFGFFRGMSNYVLELLHRLDCHTNCPTRLNVLSLSSFDIFFKLFILNT